MILQRNLQCSLLLESSFVSNKSQSVLVLFRRLNNLLLIAINGTIDSEPLATVNLSWFRGPKENKHQKCAKRDIQKLQCIDSDTNEMWITRVGFSRRCTEIWCGVRKSKFCNAKTFQCIVHTPRFRTEC